MTATQDSVRHENAINDAVAKDENGSDESTPARQNGRLSYLFSFLRRRQSWLVIDGYHVEDLHTDQPVTIREGATLVGNIRAPKLVVSGLLSGSAIAQEILVESKGQIWGDIFTVSLKIAPGGKIQGWVSSVDKTDFQTIQSYESGLDEHDFPIQLQSSDEAAEGPLMTRSDAQLESLHYLQTETAVALAARTEIEHDFERRLTEVAGEASSKIATLTEQLTELRGELTSQKTQLDENQDLLQQRKTQIERQTKELNVARQLLTDQNEELGNLRDSYQKLQEAHEILQTEKADIDSSLEEANKQIDTYSDRVHSLETAHRSSLQHSAEQEESLIRWQELAEVTEKRAEELQEELSQVRFQIEESSNTIELLRHQRRDIEEQLIKALEELDELRQSSTKSLVDPEILAEAAAKAKELEEKLAQAEHEHYERVLWYKANLETTRSALADANDQMTKAKTRMNRLKQDVSTYKAEAEKWQTAVHEQEAILAEHVQKTNAQQEKLEQWQQKTKREKKNLQETVRAIKLQLEANEAELAQYIEATRKQGRHLAEIQTQLVERELQIKKARALINKQNEFIQQMKQVTGERIRALQTQLVQLKKRQGEGVNG